MLMHIGWYTHIMSCICVCAYVHVVACMLVHVLMLECWQVCFGSCKCKCVISVRIHFGVCVHACGSLHYFAFLCMQLLCCMLVSACWWIHFGEKVFVESIIVHSCVSINSSGLLHA